MDILYTMSIEYVVYWRILFSLHCHSDSWNVKKTLKIVSLTGLRAYSVFPNFRNQPLLLYKSIVDEKSDESTPERQIF